MGKLDGKRIAFLATDGVEEVELTEPLKAVKAEGADVDLLSLKAGEFQGFDHGAICHAPWTLVEADVIKGRTLTSWPSLQTDIRNAGATWVDEQVHVDQGLVTSRKPDDLPAFNAKIVEEFAEGRHERAGGRVRVAGTGAGIGSS